MAVGLLQNKFRGRNDDGNQTTATWKATENTNFSQAVDINFRVRFQVQNTSLGTITFATRLQYNLNGAGWNDITASSLVVKAITSGNVADTTATTDQMSSGITFLAGEVTADGLTASQGLASLGVTEHELICQIVSADVINGDTIQIRCIESPATVFTGGYTNTPTITVTEAVTFIPKVIMIL